MRGAQRRTQVLGGVLLGLALALLVPAAAVAAKLYPTLLAKVSYGAVPPSFARTADGTLHVAFESNINWGASFNGVAATSISPSGHVGPLVQALNWNTSGGSPSGIPGLAVLPSGALEATFGDSPSGDAGPWGMSSSDGGSTWSAPTDVGSHSNASSVGGGVTFQVSGTTPVIITGCCGGISVQQGFGAGSPTYQLTNSTDGVAGNVDSAVDDATGAVIAAWDSAAGSGGLWFQQVAPTEGTAVKVPVPTQYGTGAPLIVAGRDTGPGVFAAYPENYANTTQIGLIGYGGGTVPVGSVNGLHADQWGAATGPDGRIWVFWDGIINGKGVTAVTRSNKAMTRFEPIQLYGFNWSGGITLSGDGRLGPLDLLIGGTPATPANAAQGIYYARIMPELTEKTSIKRVGHSRFRVTVKVTDAGDPVSGASVSIKGKHGTTNAQGIVKLKVSGTTHTHIGVKVTKASFTTTSKKTKL